jgi:hypothetical protein
MNEVYASAEDGLWTEGSVTAQANSVRSPAAPSHRGISIGRELVLFDEQKAWTRDAALCSLRIYRKDIGAGAQAATQEPRPVYRNRLPLVQSCAKG